MVSFVKATKDSDVDLFIIASTKERFFERMATVKKPEINLFDRF